MSDCSHLQSWLQTWTGCFLCLFGLLLTSIFFSCFQGRHVPPSDESKFLFLDAPQESLPAKILWFGTAVSYLRLGPWLDVTLNYFSYLITLPCCESTTYDLCGARNLQDLTRFLQSQIALGRSPFTSAAVGKQYRIDRVTFLKSTFVPRAYHASSESEPALCGATLLQSALRVKTGMWLHSGDRSISYHAMQKTSVWYPTKDSRACTRGRERRHSSYLWLYLILLQLFHLGHLRLWANCAVHWFPPSWATAANCLWLHPIWLMRHRGLLVWGRTAEAPPDGENRGRPLPVECALQCSAGRTGKGFSRVHQQSRPSGFLLSGHITR